MMTRCYLFVFWGIYMYMNHNTTRRHTVMFSISGESFSRSSKERLFSLQAHQIVKMLNTTCIMVGLGETELWRETVANWMSYCSTNRVS